MKRKYIYSAVIALMLAGSSCSDFLDRDPDSIVSDELVFSDESMVKSVLANYYGRLEWGERTSSSGDYQYLDEAIRCDGGASEHRTFGDDWWRVYDYELIRNFNQFLISLKNVELDNETRNRYEGEVRFLRAYTYFTMCKGLGGVPIVGDEVFEYSSGMDVTSLQYARSSEVETYDYIISECSAIAEMLPTEATKNSARATKWAALALKSRAALYAGSIAKYNSGLSSPIQTANGEVGIPASKASDYYKTAFETAEIIIKQSPFQLQQTSSDKTENFYAATSLKDNNVEVIWARDYVGPDNYIGFTRENVPPSHAEDVDRGYLGVILNLVEDFEYINNSDGSLKLTDDKGNYIYYEKPLDLFENKDPRLFATVIVPGGSFRDTEVTLQTGLMQKGSNGEWNFKTGNPGTEKTGSGLLITSVNGPVTAGEQQYINKTGFFLKKFMDETIGATLRGKGSEMWFPRFRMGEVYLIASEAAMELGDQANALTYINAIRERAGISLLSGSVTLDNIIQERRVELAFENHRWWDAKRWRIADKLWDNNENTRSAVPYALYPYKVDAPGDPNDGKWIFDEERAYMVKYPRYFQMRNYYNFFDNSWLNNNPKLVKNPYQN